MASKASRSRPSVRVPIAFRSNALLPSRCPKPGATWPPIPRLRRSSLFVSGKQLSTSTRDYCLVPQTYPDSFLLRAMNIFEDLEWRGLVADCTDLSELQKRLGAGPT